MPDTIFVVIEHRDGSPPTASPYLSKESAQQHYEETIAVYSDVCRPYEPLIENEARNHFRCGNFECGYYEEELYA